MADQVVLIMSKPGRVSPTVQLYAEFTDDEVGSAVSAVPGSSNLSLYEATFSNVPAGRYRWVLLEAGVEEGFGFVTLLADAGRYPSDEMKEPSSGAGLGNSLGSAFQITLTLTRGSGVPIPSCDVILTTTDVAPSLGVYANGVTEADGTFTLLLDEGTYYLWRQKAGYNFTNPVTLVVDSEGQITQEG